jgi:prepilin signal peptidase PulO-like enzyme (type II secretory pathway)
MEIIIGIIIFFFGVIIGSFLNVVILRMNTGRTLKGRSMCFSCGKTLHWHELVPLASFFVQRGKCTKCRARISWQYPIVEAITGLVFLFITMKYMYLIPWNVPYFLILLTFSVFVFSIWIVISVYDIRHTIIPNGLVWCLNGVIFASLFLLGENGVVLHAPSFEQILAGPVIALPFALLWRFSKGKLMGLGDAKLMLGMGWLLGLMPGIIAVVISFWIGAAISIMLMALNKKKKYNMQSAIPFGPFLVLGTFLVYVFSQYFESFVLMLSV